LTISFRSFLSFWRALKILVVRVFLVEEVVDNFAERGLAMGGVLYQQVSSDWSLSPTKSEA
jgi:hypothetical protein